MRTKLGLTLVKVFIAAIFLLAGSAGEVLAAQQPASLDRNPVRDSAMAQEAAACGNFGVTRTFSASFDRVFAASLAVLEEMGEPTSLDDPARGLINTESISVENERLREIVTEKFLEFLGQREGRYLLSLCLEAVSDQSTTVTVTPLILVEVEVEDLLGGRPLPSNGTLETEHLDAIEERLGGTIPQPPRASQNCCESGAKVSANIQVNQADHNASTLGNSTTQSETSIAGFGSTLVVGWNDSSEFATTGLGGLTSLTGYGFSTDGGLTFTDAGLLAPATSFRNLGDPALAVDRAGTFYFASLTDNPMTGDSRIAVAQSTSTSPTVVFGTPVLIPGLNPSGFQDKELIAVDTSGGSFDGRVYVTWSEFANAFDSTPSILLARSTSVTPLAFAAPIALSPTDALNQGAMPAVGPNGEVYVVWGRFEFSGGGISAQSVRLLRSNDGGVTFINPDSADPNPNKTVASSTPTPDFLTTGGPANRISRTRGFPYIAVDNTPAGSPTRGNVYVVFQADPDGAGADLSDVFFTRSTDGGATWSTPVSVHAGTAVTSPDTTTNDNWQPSIAVSPGSGDIAVTFYDRRNDTTSADGDPPNTEITLFRSVSRDGGLTWTNEPVSNVAFIPSTGYDPIIQSTYMGDYNYIVADASSFHMTWADTRNLCAPPPSAPSPCSATGRPDQDVFYAKEPVNSDLSITKTAAPDPVTIGQTLTYTLSVMNNGPSTTTAVTATDTLPVGVTFVSATSSQGVCTEAAGVVTCELSTLVNGASALVTIDVTVDSSAICGSSLLNNAVVEGNVPDSNMGDNTASTATLVDCPANLSITKTAAPDPVNAGDDLTYTLNVKNNGPSDATGVMVTDTLPAGVTFVSANPPGICSGMPTVTCSLGNLPAGSGATITIVVTVDPALAGGTITNTASVTATETDPDPTNNTASTDTAVMALCTILDDFNRPNGPLGSNWDGRVRGYRIRDNLVAVRTGRPIYWQPESYGPDQQACVTLTRINPRSRQHGLLLKVQELNNWRKGAILVTFNARSGNVDVKARDVSAHKWILVGSFAPATPVVDGDQLQARAFADGTVEVLINNVSLGTADAGSFYVDKGGQIGLWFRNPLGGSDDDDDDDRDDRYIQEELLDEKLAGRRALLDDFGGGTIAAP